MPSPTDAVSAVLRYSLNGVSRKAGNDCNGESNNLDSALAAGNKLAEITKHHVEYESTDNTQSSSQNILKSKYVVLDTKVSCNTQNTNSSFVNGSKNSECVNGGASNGGKFGSNGLTTSHQSGPQLNGVKGVQQNGLSYANVNGFTKNMAMTSVNGNKKLTYNGTIKTGSSNNSTENGSSKSANYSDSTLPEPKQTLYQPDKVTLGWQNHFRTGAGMVNQGNTCYLNATLQALFHIPAFVEWLLNDTEHMKKCEQINGPGFGDCITCSMAKTLKLSQNHPVVKPQLITSKIKLICRHMSHGSQEDAHEFMRHLLENMEKAYLVRFKAQKLDPYSKETTPINQIFGGYIRTEVKCLKCDYASTTFQHFQDLILDIRKASKVEDAMDQYFSREKLDGENSYKCEKCKCGVPATKKYSIERPPKVLCIQLKRFNAVGLKLAKPVEHRIHMDLKRYVHQQSGYAKFTSLPYKLISMVTHVGPSSGCGHYTAIAQCSSKSFHHFDDTHVHPVSVQAVLNNCAYILIYEMEPQAPKQVSKKIIATSSVASITTLGINCHNNVNGATKSTTSAPGGLPLAKDRDRVAFGMSASKPASVQPRLVIHPKRPDASNCLPSPQERKVALLSSSPLKPSNNQNGSLSKEARPSNFIGPVQVVANGKHSASSPSKGSKTCDDLARKDMPGISKADEFDKKPLASLVPYDCDDDSSSRDSSLSPPLNDDQEVLTVKATKPSGWQVTNSSGLRSPSIHSESSNHSVASATGSNWNVTENQPLTIPSGTKTTSFLKTTKDKKLTEQSPCSVSYSSDPEVGSQTLKPMGEDQSRAKSVERDFSASGSICPSKHSFSAKKAGVRRFSLSSESETLSSKQIKKKAKIERLGEEIFEVKESEKLNVSLVNNERDHKAVCSSRTDSTNRIVQQNLPMSWNGDGNSKTVTDLMKMSHQGFGNDRVTSWSGEQSQIERNFDEERQASWKRSRDTYESELDQGRMKKTKKDNRWRPYQNSFQNASSSSYFHQNNRRMKKYNHHNQNPRHQFNKNQHNHGHRKWQSEHYQYGNRRY